MNNLNFYDETPELNITPLVDVMLVLFVILILIIPAVRYDEQINLPKGSQKQVSLAKPNDYVLTISKENIRFMNKFYSYKNFFDNLLLLSNSLNKGATIFIAGDSNVKYEIIINTLTALKKVGFNKISLQTK